jgi:hypothetical protein
MDDGRVTERSATVLDLISHWRHSMRTRLLALSALIAVSLNAAADVTYDANGVGFVGKGDIKNVFGWSNDTLDANAASLQFQLLTTAGATWQCLGYNPQNRPVLTTHGLESSAIESAVAFDVRKNRQGNVTGIDLNGADISAVTYTEVGKCPSPSLNANWVQQPTLVEGSLVYSGGGDPLLQVTSDGTIWHDLPVTL